MFTENYARGGGNRYMIDMVNALQDDYEEVMVTSNAGGIYPEDVRRLERLVERCNVHLITRSSISVSFRRMPAVLRKASLVLEPLFLLYNIGLFMRLIRSTKPDHILCCNGGYPAAQASLAMVIAAKISRVPAILSIVSMPARRRVIVWPYEVIVDKLIWMAAYIVVINAAAIAKALCDHRGALPEKLKIIYNGIENRPPKIAAKGGDSQFVIGCIARMDASKGVIFLFDAFLSLVKIHPELRLVLVGDGDASEELARRTKFLGLQNKVRLVGHYGGDVCALLDTFDVYIFPSLWEGFPYSVIEALRSGCAIVATKVGGIPEAIKDGVDGLLINPGSKDAIIRAIEVLMSNEEKRQTLTENARKELTLPKMHQRVREVFAELQGQN